MTRRERESRLRRELTERDWEEIESLEFPGEQEVKRERIDWPLVYRRLREKARQLRAGEYGPQDDPTGTSSDRQWSAHLLDIADVIRTYGLHRRKAAA